MKTLTCRQLGGSCEEPMHGKTADEVIKAQDRHLKDAIKSGDTTHEQAHKEMKDRWKHPKRSVDWYSSTKSAFAELPEDD